jgi:hypothetical protein
MKGIEDGIEYKRYKAMPKRESREWRESWGGESFHT